MAELEPLQHDQTGIQWYNFERGKYFTGDLLHLWRHIVILWQIDRYIFTGSCVSVVCNAINATNTQEAYIFFSVAFNLKKILKS